MIKTILILTVGTKADPLIKSINEHLNIHPYVFLLFGRPFPNQDPNPLEVTNEVINYLKSIGLPHEAREIPDPEDIDKIIEVSKSLLQEIVERFKPEEIIINYTGGTKPMSAGIVHAALLTLTGIKLDLIYVGGPVRDKNGRVIKEAMTTRRSVSTFSTTIAEHAYRLAKNHAYTQAKAILDTIPAIGKAKFLKEAIDALYFWDEFRYEESINILDKIEPLAKHSDHLRKEYPDLTDTITRLSSLSKRFLILVNNLKEIESQGLDKKKYLIIKSNKDFLPILPLDTLENAKRRYIEGKYTDAALRSYRAVEQTIQINLLINGVNPWNPRKSIETSNNHELYKRAIELESPIDLYKGVSLLQTIEDLNIKRELDTLSHIRNHSPLEHGYSQVDRQKAQKALNIATKLIDNISLKLTNIDKNQIQKLRKIIEHKI